MARSAEQAAFPIRFPFGSGVALASSEGPLRVKGDVHLRITLLCPSQTPSRDERERGGGNGCMKSRETLQTLRLYITAHADCPSDARGPMSPGGGLEDGPTDSVRP